MNRPIATKRAGYIATIALFMGDEDDAILGQLARSQTGDLTPNQRDAWLLQIGILRSSLAEFPQSSTLCFEYVIPRMGKRADNIILAGNSIIVIEFKVGATSHDRAAQLQTVDYALDLKNFHEGSQDARIVPILVATSGQEHPLTPSVNEDGVAEILLANRDTLGAALRVALELGQGPLLEAKSWLRSGYRPTPTIIQASQAMYRGHDVTEITRSEAGADNLGFTTQVLSNIIDESRVSGGKSICFVTGVPGAGKTLAGLNLANARRRADTADVEHAVFLSGNGPLVKVLQEGLARDDIAHAKERGERMVKVDAERRAKSFIQNIHHFRDEYIRNPSPPVERVVVFDEAQRAWDSRQTSKFMQQKRGLPDFESSEPAFLIGTMDRHEGWAVIVCLVGGGQEINTGEAGMEEWFMALRDHYPLWDIYLPDQIAESEYLPNIKLDYQSERLHKCPGLHLGVSIRSFRSELVSDAIGSLLNSSGEQARSELQAIRKKYPVRITRSLAAAKTWIRQQARGTERYGLLSSSSARRLKPLGILSGSVKGNECNWFLNDDQDVRSSFYLEDAATEFEVQGLELDWAIVVWGGDFIRSQDGWEYRSFKGTRWQRTRKESDQNYRLNAYRVLLTRARQGMVVVVPDGDVSDPTRIPEFYDPTWEYLENWVLKKSRYYFAMKEIPY